MSLKMLKAAVAGLVLSVSGFANAGLIALDSTQSVGNQGYTSSLAMYFNVLSAINVTQLGAYDSLADGFQSNTLIQVGIFDRNTGLMVTEVASFSGNLNTLIGNSRFFDIADVTLDIGQYGIVARGFNNLDKNGNSGGGSRNTINNGNGAIQFVGSSYFGGTSINDFGLNRDGGGANRYDAGTFMYTQVPEPTTLAIFALGIMGLAARRFKKQ